VKTSLSSNNNQALKENGRGQNGKAAVVSIAAIVGDFSINNVFW
jgi:hypothetical protein